MLYASETWPLTTTNLQHLEQNDKAMIRQICSFKSEDVATVRSASYWPSLRTLVSFREREGITGFDMWSVLVVQSEQHVI